MPEGDTVFLAATRLNAALAGATLERTDFRGPRYATVNLAGRQIEEVRSHGKHILTRIGSAPGTAEALTLHTHFRMDGTWHLYRPEDRWQAPAWQARVVLATARWIAVGFRMPVVELMARAGETDVVGTLGPD